VAPLVAQQAEHLQRWHDRATRFLAHEARDHLRQWTAAFARSLLPGDSDAARRDAAVDELFPAPAAVTVAPKGPAAAKGKAKSATAATAAAAAATESPAVACFRRAAQLFLEPYFLLGTTALPAAHVETLLDLRLALWLLSTASVWGAVFAQHRLHRFAALTAPASPFRRLLAASAAPQPARDEDAVQVPWSVLRRVAQSGVALATAAATHATAAVCRPLAAALADDLAHVAQFTDELLRCGRDLRQSLDTRVAAQIVYRDAAAPQRRACVEAVVDLLDLDGRSVTCGGVAAEEDAVVPDAAAAAAVARLRRPAQPVAHFDLACLFSLAQQHQLRASLSTDGRLPPASPSGDTLRFAAQLQQLAAVDEAQQSPTAASAAPADGGDAEETFCWCGQLDEGAVPLLACDRCDTWCHATCVRMWSQLRQHQRQVDAHRRWQRQQQTAAKKAKRTAGRAATGDGAAAIDADGAAAASVAAPSLAEPAEVAFVCIGCDLLARRRYALAWDSSAA
jgi:hypothetical protein